MSIFGKIKDAIFGHKPQAQASSQGTTGATQSYAPAPAATPSPAPTGNAYADAPIVAPTQSAQTTVVNVESNLDSMSGADKLNWRNSIVDLMKLLNIDSDFANRKELATELGRADYKGDADDNLWLHQRVMQELAANGGEVPANLRG